MNKTKLFGFAALAGLFLIGTLMPSPHNQANGAVYSTPVSVVNTTANPGSVLDANTATRVPYQSTVSVSGCGFQCSMTFPLVPLGFRLVVEYVGGFVTAFNTQPPVGVLSYIPGFGGSANWSTVVPGASQQLFGQSMRAYIDPGTPTFQITTGDPGAGTARITLTGYLQDCSVSPCPAQKN